MLKRFRGRARLALAGGLVVVLIIAMTALYAVVVPSQALGAQATVTILTGTVEVRDAGATSFSTGKDLGVIGPGATLRTGTDGNALLTFFDGSTVTIEPGTELTLEQLETTGAGASFISIVQVVGRTWHVVGRTLPPGAVYSVRTNSATAVVRGTAFDFSVDEQGGATTLTEEGTVALTAQGQTVEVGPDQVAEAPADAPPTQPAPAPPPDNVVKVIIDPTNSAAAVDSKGRAVAIVNGIPNITVPRGKVEFIDGKIVMSIPVAGTERVSTVVQSTDPAKAVAIQTQVETKGVIVNNALEVRVPDASGFAKGGVALTTAGLIVLPDEEARRFTAPRIAPAPEVRSGVPFGGPVTFLTTERLKGLPQVEIARPATGAAPPATFVLPAGVTLPADVKVGEFRGGFQQFSFFGFTRNITKQPGFDPTKAAGLEFAANGVAAPQGFNYATFNGALPPGLVPPPPPGATDFRNAGAFEPPAGFSFPPLQVPARGGDGALPFDPATIPSFNLSPEVQQRMQQQMAQFQQIAQRMQQQGTFAAPTGEGAAAGASPQPGGFPTLQRSGGFPNPFASPGTSGDAAGGVGPSPFQGQLAEGCRNLGFLGVVCNNAAPIAAPGGVPGSFPPGAPFTGSFPPGGFPSGQPFSGSFPPGGFPSGQPFPPGGSFPVPVFSGAPPSGGFVAPPPGTVCTPPSVPLGDGRCGPPPSFVPTGSCTAPLVLLPDGKCGTTPTLSGATLGPCPAPLITLPDGRCGEPPTGSATPAPGTTCPDGTAPVNGVCPTPSGFTSPTPGTTCPDGSAPVNGVCPTPSGFTSPTPGPTCPDGSAPVNGVCPTPSGFTSPTPLPTLGPTPLPTPLPTLGPTPLPTLGPTPLPTPGPTPLPTSSP